MGSITYAKRPAKEIALTISDVSFDPEPITTPSKPNISSPSLRKHLTPKVAKTHFVELQTFTSYTPRYPKPDTSSTDDDTCTTKLLNETQDQPVVLSHKMFWDEARGQLRMAAPIVGMNVVQMLLVLSSAAFVGHLGSLELASCQLATTLANASGHYVMMGMSLGFETLGGRAFGAGQFTELGHLMLCTIAMLTGIAAVVSITWTQSVGILLALGQDPQLAEMAGRYLKRLIPSVFAHAWTAPLVVFLQSQGVTGPLAWCSALTLLLHVPCNWFFIYHLDWKADGAATATSLSYVIMFLLLGGHVYFSKRYNKSKPRFAWNKTFQNWRPLVRLALPSTVMLCLEYWAFDILYVLSGLLPDPYVVVSALSVAMNTAWLASMTYIGLGAALSTRVSTELGSNESAAARNAARVGLTTGAALGVFTFAVVMATHPWVPLIFVSAENEKLRLLSSQLMMIVAFIALGDAISQSTQGVIRGCGRQPLGATITLSSYYVIGLPTCAMLAFGFKFGVWGLVGGQVIGSVCQAAFLATAVAFTNWPRQAARALASVLETGGAVVESTADEDDCAGRTDSLEM